MDEVKRREIYGWLMKSRRDLVSARRLLRGEEPLRDVAVYHCQQAVEKALKAYLVYRDLPFEKTHNLVALLSRCLPLDAEFENWKMQPKFSPPMPQSSGIRETLWSLSQKKKRPLLWPNHL